MNREKIYSSKQVDIEYDLQGEFIYANWKGFQTIDSVKGGCEKILDTLKKKRCTKVLNDNRQVTGPWQGAAEWGAKEWFPRMFEAGLQRFAWIQSNSVFSQLSAEKTLSETDKNQKNEIIRTFDELEAARKWLVS